MPEFSPRRCGAVVVLDDETEFVGHDELRGELIGVASHELKSPLTALQMNLMLLSESMQMLSPHQQASIADLVLGCEELGRTVEELQERL